MEAVAAVEQLGGIGDYGAILRLTTRKRLRRAVARGALVSASRGRYALPEGDLAHEAARRLQGHLSHLVAARHHGWEVARQRSGRSWSCLRAPRYRSSSLARRPGSWPRRERTSRTA